VNTSPVSPDDIRAAAAAHHELGPEYSDAVVAAFLERVDRAVAARVEARLDVMHQVRPERRATRRALLTGLAIGACCGALGAGLAIVSLDGGSAPAASRQGQVAPNVRLLPFFTYDNGQPGSFHLHPRLSQPGGG
jgi:ferric-dicitrate binding protein FerR (iron transport regulator)